MLLLLLLMLLLLLLLLLNLLRLRRQVLHQRDQFLLPILDYIQLCRAPAWLELEAFALPKTRGQSIGACAIITAARANGASGNVAEIDRPVGGGTLLLATWPMAQSARMVCSTYMMSFSMRLSSFLAALLDVAALVIHAAAHAPAAAAGAADPQAGRVANPAAAPATAGASAAWRAGARRLLPGAEGADRESGLMAFLLCGLFGRPFCNCDGCSQFAVTVCEATVVARAARSCTCEPVA